MESAGSDGVESRVAALLEGRQAIEALALLEPAIGAEPENGRLYWRLGQGLAQLGRHREAIDAFNAACFFLPDPTDALVAMGDAQRALRAWEDAVVSYRAALAQRPQLSVLQAVIAFTRFQQGRGEEALALARQAVQAAPDHAYAHYVLGMVSFCFDDPRHGIASLERALAIDPHHALARSSLGTARLALGDLDRSSWAAYHERLRVPDYRQPPQPVRHLPEWDGSPIPGRLLLWMEQGLGDWLFSLRFVERIGLPPSQLVIAIDPRLHSLVQRSLPACEVVAEDSLDPSHLGVSHIFPLCSLGMWVELEGVMEGRWPTPYLQPDPAKVERFRSELAAQGPGLKVGLSWSSDPQRSHGQDKSVPLRLFRRLAEVEGVQLVDLQYGDTEAERRAFAALTGKDLLSLPFDRRDDLESLAALIRACDVVVTVSNVTAHLAGALGVPGFVLLPAAKGLFWYWHRERSDSPWYPSLTLVRQQRPGAWEEAVARVSERVAHICLERFGSDPPASRAPLPPIPPARPADAPIGHPVLLRWLERSNAVRPATTRLPADLLPPYAAALGGDDEAAIEAITTLLEQQPGRLDGALLLGGINALRGRGDALFVEEPEDPAQQQRLNTEIQAALQRLALPLLTPSDVISKAGCSLNAAELLRFFATHAYKAGENHLAVRCLSQAVEHQPEDPQIYIHLFNVLDASRNYTAAHAWLLKGLAKWPRNIEMIRLLRDCYRADGWPRETLQWARKAYLVDKRNFPDALYYLCHVPVISSSPEEAQFYRRRMLRNLRRLEGRDFADPGKFQGGLIVPSFMAAYQNADNRRLLERQAAVFRRAFRPFVDRFASPPPSRQVGQRQRKIRIAFISENFRSSSNARAYEGLIRHLDRERFHVAVLHNSDSIRDANRDRIDTYADEAIVLPKRLMEATRMICDLSLDVLFYTDIGTSAFLYILALARLAPLQLTGWGIPHTSGLSTIDAYISSSLLEPPAAGRLYTERLHLVSRLPCCYLREQLPPVRPLGRDYFLLPEGVFLFACPQQLPKLHPDFDPILEELARRHPDALFVFVEDVRPHLTQKVLERWRVRAPTLVGRSRFLATMNRLEFVALCACVDLLLDPPHYSSGITFYESAHTGTPTVGFMGRYLRSRFVAGAYRMLKLQQPPVATTPGEYVDLCTSLAADLSRRHALREELTRKAEDSLYEDLVYVREVGHFLASTLAC